MDKTFIKKLKKDTTLIIRQRPDNGEDGFCVYVSPFADGATISGYYRNGKQDSVWALYIHSQLREAVMLRDGKKKWPPFMFMTNQTS